MCMLLFSFKAPVPTLTVGSNRDLDYLYTASALCPLWLNQLCQEGSRAEPRLHPLYNYRVVRVGTEVTP